jgi:hypothetical protein
MRLVDVGPGVRELGWRAGDVRFQGQFEGDQFRGKAFNRSDLEWFRRCLGRQTEIPVNGLIVEANRLTLRLDSNTYNPKTCLLLSRGEATWHFSRLRWEARAPWPGILFFFWGKELFVVRALEGSSAERAGLRPNDRILSVDGRTSPPLDLLRRTFGARGTKVRVTILRPGEEEREIELVRDVVPVEE